MFDEITPWANSIGTKLSSNYTPAVTHVIVYMYESKRSDRFSLESPMVIGSSKSIGLNNASYKINLLKKFIALDKSGECGPKRSREDCRKGNSLTKGNLSETTPDHLLRRKSEAKRINTV